MTVKIKSEPRIVRANGSHWLELDRHNQKEELYPILELEAPRAGLVRAQFRADRYVFSDGDWSDWRVILQEVRSPDVDRPELPHLGRPAEGIGDQTRAAISEACRPLVFAWLESDEYRRSKQHAAAAWVARKIDAPAAYRLEHARSDLDKVGDLLAPGDRVALGRALEQLQGARQILDAMVGDA